MDFKMRILLRAVNQRIADGEQLEAILLTYPKLSEDEITIIKQEVNE